MKNSTIIWLLVMAVSGAFLIVNAFFTEKGMAREYVKTQTKTYVAVTPFETPYDELRWVEAGSSAATADRVVVWVDPKPIEITTESSISVKEFNAAKTAGTAEAQGMSLSLKRTLGLWVAAFFTLAIFSFMIRDNPIYKFAESVFIGVSAAYWMVIAFWDTLVPNLLGKLTPEFVKSVFVPGIAAERDLWFLIPLALGIMLLWRLAPVGTWISRWPIAFTIGVFAGLTLVNRFNSDFISQIKTTIQPLIELSPDPANPTAPETFDLWATVRNITILLSVFACLTYFFFSVEHKGVVGKVSRIGIWVLMIYFGSAFGYTVMGRVALLAARFEFLFDDWLWLIDPTGARG